MKRLVRDAVSHAGELSDIEVVETHHRHKQDAPSGTALALARVIAANRLEKGQENGTTAGADVPIHSLRLGGVPGEHSVHLASDEEVLTVSHRALSRDVFARGAIRAARFLAGRPSGFYTMQDLIDDVTENSAKDDGD